MIPKRLLVLLGGNHQVIIPTALHWFGVPRTVPGLWQKCKPQWSRVLKPGRRWWCKWTLGKCRTLDGSKMKTVEAPRDVYTPITFLIVAFMYILIANTTWSFFYFWWCTQWNIKLHRSVGGNRLHSLRNWGTLLRIWKIFSHVWTLFKHGRSMQKLWQSMVIQCCWYSLVLVDFGDSFW